MIDSFVFSVFLCFCVYAVIVFFVFFVYIVFSFCPSGEEINSYNVKATVTKNGGGYFLACLIVVLCLIIVVKPGLHDRQGGAHMDGVSLYVSILSLVVSAISLGIAIAAIKK